MLHSSFHGDVQSNVLREEGMRLRSIQIHRPAKSFHTLPMKICGSHISGSYFMIFTVVQALSNMIHTQFPNSHNDQTWWNEWNASVFQAWPIHLLYPWPPWPPTKVGTLTPTISGWTKPQPPVATPRDFRAKDTLLACLHTANQPGSRFFFVASFVWILHQ